MVTGALPSKHTVVPRRSQGTKAARSLLEKNKLLPLLSFPLKPQCIPREERQSLEMESRLELPIIFPCDLYGFVLNPGLSLSEL